MTPMPPSTGPSSDCPPSVPSPAVSGSTRVLSRPLAAVAGVVAAAAGMGASELVAGFARSLQSPVVSIGNRVVDAVPQPVKQFAIDTFGTNDKLALIAGILVVLTVLAGGIGIVARTHRRVGAIATAALAATAAVAALVDPLGGPVAMIPAFVAGVVAVPTLLWLTAPPVDGATGDVAPGDADGHGVDRRRFLVMTGGAATAAVVAGGGGRLLARRFSVADQRQDLQLPTPGTVAPPVPAGAHPDVEGLSKFVTDNSEFYRVDTALQVPQLSAEGWTLRVHGMVDEEVKLSYQDLLDMDAVDLPITMTCVSNEVGGDLVGTARWQGVRLADVLQRAGVDDAATQVVGRAHDGWTGGFPVAAAFDRDAIVAWGMNGEPLPPEHGFPLRLVTPGLYGYVSATKWLTELELTTFEEFDMYWVERDWVQRAPIKVSSRIDTPAGLATLDRGTVAVAGVAWAQTRGIQRVEVQVDDGEFEEADLAEEVSADTWRQWVYRWDTTELAPGRHQLTVRATDADGTTQTRERMPPFPSGSTGWHSIAVLVAEA